MAPGSFGALWCSWKRRPLSSGVIAPQVVIAPTGVAQTGNANDIAPASAEGILEAPTYRLNPDEARNHVNCIRRFRILIMGRANSGKTSVLQRICNTTDQPEIFDGEGRKVDPSVIQGSLRCGHHDIENELVFKSNPHFVFHDSCGFEAGSISAFNQMKEFVMDHAKTPKLEMRVHAIWYCIPLSDTTRMVTATERKFFDECDTGHVPVIVLLTKADILELDAMEEIEDPELEVDWAQVAEVQKRILDENLAKIKRHLNVFRFQPYGFLPLTDMHKEGADCTALLTCTTNALNEENLQMLLILTQQSNLALCIEFAVMKTLKGCMELS